MADPQAAAQMQPKNVQAKTGRTVAELHGNVGEIDALLKGWLKRAFEAAG